MADAKKVFFTFGYQKSTMDDIARRIGLRKNTLYYYYKNKEELFNEVMKEDLEGIIIAVVKKVEKPKTAEAKVKTFVNAVSQALFDRAQMYAVNPKILLEFLIVLEHSGNPRVEKMLNFLSGILKEGIRNKEFIKHDYREFAVVLMEYIMSYNFTHLSKSIYEGISFAELKSVLKCEIFLQKGIGHMLNGIKNKQC